MRKFFPVMLLSLLPTYCLAWGFEGHAVVGAIADANLTPKAQAQVALLLKNDLTFSGNPSGRTSLSSVASWADEIRSTDEGKAEGNWHFRDNPVCSSEAGPCPDGNCIDVKLQEMIATLKNPAASERQKNETLKWVVHLVGDIHQPLHVGENHDRGGNDIPVALAGIQTKGNVNLHKVWDSDLVHLVLEDGPVTATLTPDYRAGTIAQWMQEGRDLARTTVYGNLPDFACTQPASQDIVVLTSAYQAAAKIVIRQQLIQAGLRLAVTLNQVFN